MFQHMELWPLCTFIMIFFITYVLLKSMKDYIQGLGILQLCTLPGIKCNNVIFYLSLFISHCKNSTPACPSLCAFLETAVGLCHLYGENGLFRISFLFKSAVLFFKAETVEAVLSNPELIDKSKEYRLLQPLLGTGLITSHRTKWQKHRKLLTPTFHTSILGDFIPLFQEQTNVLISKIKNRNQEPWIDIVPLLSLCALDIICQTAMGISMNLQLGENGDYLNALHEIEETFMYRGVQPWLYRNIIFNLTPMSKKFNANLHLVHELHKKVLKKKIEKMTNDKLNSTAQNASNKCSFEGKIRKPFLEFFLEYHLKDPSITEKDIIDEISTFMGAGYETTAKAMSFALYCLGLYPDIQSEVHGELDAIFENEQNENISCEVLTKMKLLECVIKETLRLYPPGLVIARENKRPFKVLDYTVNRSTLCIIFIWMLHRDPEIFPDPEKFNPKRFLPENCKGRHPYAFIPFSAGPRNCIGQKFAMLEMKTVLSSILRRFRVKSLDARDKVLVSASLTLRNVHPLRLNFEPR